MRQFSIDFSFSVPLLSSAAWQAAQATQAVHFLDYEWLTEVARVYDLQALYVSTQSSFMDQIAGIAGDIEGLGASRALSAFRDRLHLLVMLHRGLIEGYSKLLGPSGVGAGGPKD